MFRPTNRSAEFMVHSREFAFIGGSQLRGFGSACTSQNYSASHVLTAMGLQGEQIKGALRLSWCHLTPEVRWGEVVGRIRG